MAADGLARLANARSLRLPGRLCGEVAQMSREAKTPRLRLRLELIADVIIQPNGHRNTHGTPP